MAVEEKWMEGSIREFAGILKNPNFDCDWRRGVGGEMLLVHVSGDELMWSGYCEWRFHGGGLILESSKILSGLFI